MNGILLLDKPLGMSSNRALQTVKRMLRASKAGHIGTLDPLATGMLPICLDEATKIAGEILRALQLLKLMSEDRRAEFQTQDATA
jgi:tRNA pseudouridine55 synthase